MGGDDLSCQLKEALDCRRVGHARSSS
jgi:hypothetical protein